MLKKLITLCLVAAFAAPSLGQTPSAAKPDEKAEKLRKDAIELLRETSGDVARLRTPENRVSLNAELASLMWYHDEKEAKVMYGGVVGDFKQLLAQLDAQINSGETAEDEEEFGGLFGGPGRNKAERKMRAAMAVRQQIALSLADHAPDLAYNFYLDTGSMITSPAKTTSDEFATYAERRFELQLLQRIAKADAAKGVDYARRSLKDGVRSQHVELLGSIYAKDAERGREFGAELLSQLMTERSSQKDLDVYGPLLSFGVENTSSAKDGKKPVYSTAELRSIAEAAASALLDGTAKEDTYTIHRYADIINKYAPGRGAQLRAKFKSSAPSSEEETLRSIMKEVGAMNTASNSASGVPSGHGTNTNTSGVMTREEIEAENRRKDEAKIGKDIESLANKDLGPEERGKVVAEARRAIAKGRGSDKKIVSLSLLAGQVARMGDKDLAAEIMREAERLVNPQPRNYRDFALTWLLASGYAEADPEKAFPILEGTILRANDLIAASIKMAEFIDVRGDIFEDGELQVGIFGGSMIRELTGNLGVATGTIRSLAVADITKTRALANNFDRQEVRILARMMVLRAVLDQRKAEVPDDTINGMEGVTDPPV